MLEFSACFYTLKGIVVLVWDVWPVAHSVLVPGGIIFNLSPRCQNSQFVSTLGRICGIGIWPATYSSSICHQDFRMGKNSQLVFILGRTCGIGIEILTCNMFSPGSWWNHLCHQDVRIRSLFLSLKELWYRYSDFDLQHIQSWFLMESSSICHQDVRIRSLFQRLLEISIFDLRVKPMFS